MPKIYLYILLSAIPGIGFSEMCPSNPNDKINVMHIKYKITDGPYIKAVKESGGPIAARGATEEEIIISSSYERSRYAGIEAVIDSDYESWRENELNKLLKALEVITSAGGYSEALDAEMVRVQSLPSKMKTEPFERHDVKTPRYSASYNRYNEVGYAYETMIDASDPRPNQLLGGAPHPSSVLLEKISPGLNLIKIQDLEQKRTILGHECKVQRVQMGTVDNHTDGEYCVMYVDGHQIVLEMRSGEPEAKYHKIATLVNLNKLISKKEFCLPNYVKVN